MAGAVIGALRVVLGADTAALEKGLKDAQGKLASFGSLAGKAAIGLGVAVAGAATAIGAGVKNALDQADQLGKLAQSVGVPVEQLSALAHAADLSGVSLENLGKSVGKLSKSMLDIAQGTTGPAADAFKQLGVAVQNSDGTLRSSSEVLGDIAQKFAGLKDGAAKTALAMSIFGKSGAELIPLLNQGRDGIKAMTDEARELGLVIDGQTARAAENFNDNLTRLGKIVSGIFLQIAARVAPVLENISNALLAAAKNTKLMDEVATNLAISLKALVTAGTIVSGVFTALGQVISGVVSAIKLVGSGELVAAFSAIKQGGVDAFESLRASAARASEIWSTFDQVPLTLQSVRDAIFGTKSATDQMDLAIRNSTQARQDQATAEREYQALMQQGVAVYEATRTPLETLGLEISKLNQLYDAGAISADTFARAQEAAAERAGLGWRNAVPAIAGSFAEIASAFGKENSKIAKAAQILGAVQAFIATAVGQAEALKLPFPANFAAIAAIAAKGAGLIAAIKSASVPAFQTGGSFRVGGTGGPDSQRVSFDVSPGELVDIRRPDQLNRATQVNVTLNGDRFSRDQVRELFETFNAGIRDGYRINLSPA